MKSELGEWSHRYQTYLKAPDLESCGIIGARINPSWCPSQYSPSSSTSQQSTSIHTVAHFRNIEVFFDTFPILYPSPYISLLYCANSTCKIPLKSVHISPNHPQLFSSRSASLLTWICAEVSPLPLSSSSQPFSMKSEMALKNRSDHITVLLQTLQLHLR